MQHGDSPQSRPRSRPGKFYRTRDHEASPFFKVVRDHFGALERIYPKKYQERYGYWRPLLGVEPVRTSTGRVHDIRLIPESELGRPRIDVVVQTSGQFRDIAASGLFIIDRAVLLAAQAGGENNFVRDNVREAEGFLKERGYSPAEAREPATARIFGGVNGNYGTGIQGPALWHNHFGVKAGNLGASYHSKYHFCSPLRNKSQHHSLLHFPKKPLCVHLLYDRIEKARQRIPRI